MLHAPVTLQPASSSLVVALARRALLRGRSSHRPSLMVARRRGAISLRVQLRLERGTVQVPGPCHETQPQDAKALANLRTVSASA